MSKTSSKLEEGGTARLAQLGAQVRARRVALGLSAVAVAEAAHVSRVTLHRIEAGNPSVAIGFYVAALAALGLELDLAAANSSKKTAPAGLSLGSVPIAIRIDDYPQLARLAWQVRPGAVLRPVEALGIYERNRKHLDQEALSDSERALIEGLREAWGDAESDV